MKFDLILKNGRIADVKNMRWEACADVGIKNGKIVEIGNLTLSDKEKLCLITENNNNYDAKAVVDCKGKILAPAFIDAHVHIESSMVSPREFARAVLSHGTTAVIADPHEIVNVGGGAALDAFLEMAKDAVIDIFTVVPSSVPSTPYDTNGAGKFLASDMKKYVDNSRIVGLGEVMSAPNKIASDKEISDKIRLFKNKVIDGHTAGLSKIEIAAYAAAGAQNDHECSTFEDAKLRYDNGMNVYIREGSAAHNLENIVCGLVKYNQNAEKLGYEKLSLDRFAFCTDDKHLSAIAREGHINYNVQKAVKCGMKLLEALKFASFNPSKFYSLAERGEIAVGKIADIVVLENEINPIVVATYKNGVDAKYILDNCANCDEVLGKNIEYLQNSIKYRKFVAADFDVKYQRNTTAIELVGGELLTNAVELTPNEAERANILTTIERYGKNGNFAVCPLLGYGIRCGAIASSVSHDSHNVVAAADNANDLALAINRVQEIGGGFVIASNGEIVGELALDIAGLMSSDTADKVQNRISELEIIAAKFGVNPYIDPFTTLSFVALPVIPSIRLLDTGLFDVVTEKFIK